MYINSDHTNAIKCMKKAHNSLKTQKDEKIVLRKNRKKMHDTV